MVLQEMTAWLGMKNTEKSWMYREERRGWFRQREPCGQRHKARRPEGWEEELAASPLFGWKMGDG